MALVRISTCLDYLLWPSMVLVPTVLSSVFFGRGMPSAILTSLLIGFLAVLIRMFEHIRPERLEHNALDQPLWMEAGHFLFAISGHGIAISISLWMALKIGYLGIFPVWPSNFPIILQFTLAILLHESLSYWQHRSFHRVPLFWKFHSLHHSGTLLNSLRTPRFHFIDALISTFFSYLPLSLMAAPENVLVILGVFLGATGILQHANIKFRTFWWMDIITCTPVLHRRHHSAVFIEGHCNYGNSVMLFDVLFGTFVRSNPEGPDRIGIENDPVPRGFWQQVVSPFRFKQ